MVIMIPRGSLCSMIYHLPNFAKKKLWAGQMIKTVLRGSFMLHCFATRVFSSIYWWWFGWSNSPVRIIIFLCLPPPRILQNQFSWKICITENDNQRWYDGRKGVPPKEYIFVVVKRISSKVGPHLFFSVLGMFRWLNGPIGYQWLGYFTTSPRHPTLG